MSNETLRHKTLVGRVIGNKMQKTIVVAVERKVTHPLYKKIVKRTTKLHVHDENNSCHVGDTVEITESRPIAKTKSWALVKIVEKVI